MIYNLLTELPKGGKRINVGEGLMYGLIGYIVVFLGIALLIGIVALVGKLMQRTAGGAAKKATPKEKPAAAIEQVKSETPAISVSDDGISEETIAVITAAIAAYYEKQNRTCGFTVRRIKRM